MLFKTRCINLCRSFLPLSFTPFSICLDHKRLLLPSHLLPPPLPFLTPWLHSLLLALVSKAARHSEVVSSAGGRAYSLLCSLPHWRTCSFHMIERRAFSWMLGQRTASKGEGPWHQPLLKDSRRAWEAPPAALGLGRRVRRETNQGQKSWWEPWNGCICLLLCFGRQTQYKINL